MQIRHQSVFAKIQIVITRYVHNVVSAFVGNRTPASDRANRVAILGCTNKPTGDRKWNVDDSLSPLLGAGGRDSDISFHFIFFISTFKPVAHHANLLAHWIPAPDPSWWLCGGGLKLLKLFKNAHTRLSAVVVSFFIFLALLCMTDGRTEHIALGTDDSLPVNDKSCHLCHPLPMMTNLVMVIIFSFFTTLIHAFLSLPRRLSIPTATSGSLIHIP